MEARSFHLSVQGASHIKKNKECQDASAAFSDEFCSIAVVCDGHGGNDYMRSALGSKFASEITLNNIKSFLRNVTAEQMRENSTELIKHLEASIISNWNEAVNNHFSNNPFTDKELEDISERAKKKYLDQQKIESAYGTTVIGVGMTDEFWIGIHIGDGKCVAINPEGRFLQPIPWDDKCFLNATTSICDSHAVENFRHFYSEKLPIAVFVGSDGIDDCFKGNEQLNNLYRTVLYSFMTNDFDQAVDELDDYLPRLSTKGSGDDMSIAAIIQIEKLSEIPSVRDYDTQKEKARVEAAKREEEEKTEAERIRIEEKYNRKNAEKAAAMGMVECARCGKLSSKQAKFCDNCGCSLIGEAEKKADDADQESQKDIIDVSEQTNDGLDNDTGTEQSAETVIAECPIEDQKTVLPTEPAEDNISESVDIPETEDKMCMDSDNADTVDENIIDDELQFTEIDE